MKLRVMTWNIHGFLGFDGTSDPSRTAAVVRKLDPDIVALQEVDSRDHGRGAFDGFAHFRALGHHDVVEAVTVSEKEGHYGHILASHWPILSEKTYDLTFRRREPRRLIDAYIELPDGVLRIVTSHFGLQGRERRSQIEILRNILAQDAETPAIVMGDFNEWRRGGRLHRTLGPDFGAAAAPATFPARIPLLPLDRIWSRPSGLIRRVWTAADTREASDHLPLVADLDWHSGDESARRGDRASLHEGNL